MLSDGLFRKSGVFYVMPKVDFGPLEKIFRAKVLKMKHLGLWNKKSSRSPPVPKNEPVIEIVYEPTLDDWPIYEGPSFQIN